MSTKGTKTFLILSQVYPPDPASVGQHMHDVAREMAQRGYRVKVITANRGYDDPTIKYAPRELRDGADVHRVAFSSFGKKFIALRALAMGIFMLHCLWACFTTRRLAAILVSTSPPMCGFGAAVAHSLRGVPLKYWVMDLNPDQMIELGKMKPNSLAARMLNAFQRFVLKRANDVVCMDRFMADRLYKKLSPKAQEHLRPKLTVMPPWPHEDTLEDVAHDQNPFRKTHGLDGKFVVMYSGNHGYSTPVTTVLQAALKMDREKHNGDQDIVFMFVGGGVGKKEVDQTIAEHKPGNLRSLPYQPFKELRYSLSAADVHLVTVGDSVVGVVHPCKIYGAMAVSRPILLVAPDPCHASDIVKDNRAGWHIKHGDVDGAVATVREIAKESRADLAEMGARAKGFIDRQMKNTVLCARFCDIMERDLMTPSATASPPASKPASAFMLDPLPGTRRSGYEFLVLEAPGRTLKKYVFIQDETAYLPKVLDKFLREFGDSTVGINIQGNNQGKRTLTQTALDLLKVYGPWYFQWKLRQMVWNKVKSKVVNGLMGSTRRCYTVAAVAKKYGIPVHYSADVNSEEFRGILRGLGVEFIVSISGTQLYKKALRQQTPFGIVNCHGALLPKYRGLMPSFWTLCNGETSGGTSVHFVDAKLDNGPIVVQKRYKVHARDTLEDIMARGKDLAAEAIIECVHLVESGDPPLRPNQESEMSHFSMPTGADVQRFKQGGHRFN